MQEPDIQSEMADTPEVNESQGLTLVAAPEEDTPEAAGGAEPTALPLEEEAPAPIAISDEQLQAVLEAVVYIAEEPLTLAQIANGLSQPVERVESILRRLTEEFERPEHGIGIREVAGGFKMATKAEHHEAVRSFVKSLKPPLKLSLPALETLAVIAYKQPVTAPEIMEIRGVQGAGVLKTLLDRKLIAGGGRKNVIGKPILYKTTKEFLIQFGLKDIAELPSLKEFEEIRRMAFADTEVEPVAPAPVEAAPADAGPVEAAPPEPAAAESKTEAPAEPETQPSPEPEPEG
jgi:segregation and condensation protein B